MTPAPAASSGTRSNGFTLLELVALLAIIAILAGLFLGPKDGRFLAKTVVCLNNLKQVGLANILWASDGGRPFPSQVSVTNGGCLELSESGSAFYAFAALTNRAFKIDARTFICPADRQRWQSLGTNAIFGNSTLSYFVNMDALTNGIRQILAGDRGISLAQVPIGTGVKVLSHSAQASWTPGFHKSKNRTYGQFVFVDGHGETISDRYLPAKLESAGAVTNRFVFP